MVTKRAVRGKESTDLFMEPSLQRYRVVCIFIQVQYGAFLFMLKCHIMDNILQNAWILYKSFVTAKCEVLKQSTYVNCDTEQPAVIVKLFTWFHFLLHYFLR